MFKWYTTLTIALKLSWFFGGELVKYTARMATGQLTLEALPSNLLYQKLSAIKFFIIMVMKYFPLLIDEWMMNPYKTQFLWNAEGNKEMKIK